jgi:hypothetical protein
MNKKEKAGLAMLIGIISTVMAVLIVGIPMLFMKREPIGFGSFLLGAIIAGSIGAYMGIQIPPDSRLPHQDNEPYM